MSEILNLLFRIFKRYKKKEIIKKLSNTSKGKVINGLYKSMILDTSSKFSGDLPSKILGIYEEQVQKKILEINKNKKIKYLINFGAADGYHVIGLIKKKIFKKAVAFEIDDKIRARLKINIKKNKLSSKIKVLKAASFFEVSKNINSNNIKNCFYLVDIEGDEFQLFNKENLKYYNKSYLLIENHENLNLSNKKNVKQFFKVLKNNFHILSVKQNGKNPFVIKSIENFDEDLKWLAMSECRPTNQDWLLCKPKRV